MLQQEQHYLQLILPNEQYDAKTAIGELDKQQDAHNVKHIHLLFQIREAEAAMTGNNSQSSSEMRRLRSAFEKMQIPMQGKHWPV